MATRQQADRQVVSRDILPIFVVQRVQPAEPKCFQGTGFIIAPNLFVTCWHCVRAHLPDGGAYAAVIERGEGQYQALYLDNVAQDVNGTDLATANIELKPTAELTLADHDLAYGTDVWTFGYPLTDERRGPSGGLRFTLNARYLQGYVTRSFYFQHPEYGPTPSYELDMPTPKGLSGAPLVRNRSREVVRVIYGTNDAGSIEHFARIDPQTGEREPEIQRIVSFGLAHHTHTIRNLRGPATEGLPLGEYVCR